MFRGGKIKEVMIFYYVEIKIMDIEVKKEHDSNHKGKEEVPEHFSERGQPPYRQAF